MIDASVRKRLSHPLLLVLAAAVAARLIVIPLFAYWINAKTQDASIYLYQASQALKLFASHGDLAYFPFRAPTYSFFLAAAFVVWNDIRSAFLLQIAATLLMAWSIYAILAKSDGRLALVSTLLVVTSPFLIFFEVKLYTETFYILILTVAWFLLMDDDPIRRTERAVVGGLLLGLALLSRETLLLLPLFLLAVAGTLKSMRRRLPQFAVASACAYLMVLTVPLLHVADDGKFEFGRGTAGQLLWVGTWERDGAWHEQGYPSYAFRSDAERSFVLEARKRMDDGALRTLAIDRIKADPAGVFVTWVKRYPKLWLGTRSDLIFMKAPRFTPVWYALKAIFFVLNAVTLLIAAIGILICLRRRSGLLFLALPVIYIAGIHIPFHNVETRYSLPALPFLYVFAAVALLELWDRRRRRVQAVADPAPA